MTNRQHQMRLLQIYFKAEAKSTQHTFTGGSLAPSNVHLSLFWDLQFSPSHHNQKLLLLCMIFHLNLRFYRIIIDRENDIFYKGLSALSL